MRPSLETVLAYEGDANRMALALELMVDRETPISLYQKLSDSGETPSFLLESVEGGETLGRYSFIGFAVATFRFADGHGEIDWGNRVEPIEGDPLLGIQSMLAQYRVVPQEGLPRFQGGAVGYLGFDCIRYWERVPMREGAGNIPEASFLLADELVIFDHLKHRLILLTHIPLDGNRAAHYREGEKKLQALVERLGVSLPPEPCFVPSEKPELPAFQSNMSREEYEGMVRAAKEAIAAGETFQIVLSQRLTVSGSIPPFDLYRTLRALNPSPYLFTLNFGDWAVVGASPEVLVRLEKDEILLRPIAGTRPRGKDRKEDEALERELLADEKELAEHRMLLDLGRNDVGRMSEIGTVRVEQPLHIERYSHVMHVVSDVRGTLKEGKDAFDLLRACFPAGTVSGAPKIRAMEIISELEPDRRGLYAGAVGYFDFTGNMDTCIAIRTMHVTPEEVHLQVGAGIVFDSEPAKEYEECLNKARGGLTALAITRERLHAHPARR